jgi:hypothetical protein
MITTVVEQKSDLKIELNLVILAFLQQWLGIKSS